MTLVLTLYVSIGSDDVGNCDGICIDDYTTAEDFFAGIDNETLSTERLLSIS